MILGQYVPQDSLVHKLHPTLKLILLLAIMVGLLALKGPLSFAYVIGLWFLVVFAARLSPLYVLRGLKPLLFLLVLTLTLHTLLTEGETTLFTAGPLVITQEGLFEGAYFAGRLAVLVGFTTLLTLTTSAVELAFAIEQLSKPFEVLGFPSGEFAMMLTISLRFIPVLFREMDKILKAQRCRGAPFHRGGLKDRAKAYLSILIPLFLNSFQRAEELAVAMDIRGYDPGAPRTRSRQHPLDLYDVLAAVVVLGVLALALWPRFLELQAWWNQTGA